MKSFYVSNLFPKKIEGAVSDGVIISPAAVNFNRMIAKGLVLNDCEVTCINHNTVTDETFIIEDGIIYRNLKTSKNYFIRQLSYAIQTIIYFFKWSKNSEDKFLLFDAVDSYLSFATLLISKIKKIKSVAIITDFLYLEDVKCFKDRIALELFNYLLRKSDYYVLLTKEMNEIINTYDDRYITIEGMTDIDDEISQPKFNNNKTKKCVYSGSIADVYEIYKIVDAFSYLEDLDIELNIYTFEKESERFKKSIKKINNVHNYGYKSRNEILSIQKAAFLLVNPRSCKHILTRYSFPSKIIEYMSSGTPVITTKLPGIPSEYDNYLYYFRDNDPKTMANDIRDIYNKQDDELYNKGKEAKEFVVKYKNYIQQTKKILDMIDKK